MKIKNVFLLAMTIIGLFVITGCGTGTESASENEEVTLKVGASSIPHAEILEFVAPDLEEDGVKLEIVITTDGVQTNQQTADGDLDANFFQHTPYLEQVNADSGLDLVVVEGIHIEPFGVYSKEINSIDELSDGAEIAVPNNPSNFSRALLLFADNGIIKLDEAKSGDYVLEDITENSKNLKFIPVDPPLLVHSLDDVEASAINTNYALEANLKPQEDSLIIEGNDSPYVNVLVSRHDNKDSEPIQKLADALKTEEVREFILENYEGAVVPAF
ncbi:MetQ/NlpA family ABC transporter substrate-binding protein [Oceanobacillus piezotolerans]|uniref:Lipoprotein n=1 Tax=Oceanobacillus piezotolerans TaxID=2448030 RepID=A0A498D9T0_9BACI|nr:MetQ/NlpA family ABC transporter substrate-binding protein [Oceanobacillus piezotolerans]RLL43947.1 MetQ/NlpA family ABC transporter substrate-binding protein [Oceanobacillus piezotolerans]